MKPEIFTLINGLTVIFVDTKTFPTLTTLLLIGAGSRYENKENNGIAHFLEHMFFKKYPTPEIVSTTIEGLGGVWNAFTSKHYTGYYIKGASEHFEKMVDILSDILLQPKFEEKEILKEKGVVIEEINMYEDQPQARVGELFENLIYVGNPLGMDVIGKKETVNNFSRQTIIDYRESLYRPNNAVLIVAGGLQQKYQKLNIKNKKYISNIKNYLETIKKKFNEWENGRTGDFIKVTKSQIKPQTLIYNKKTEQAHFCLGFRTFGIKDKRKYVLSVLATILGGGASSRLFVEVREKRGLCYYIHTGRELYQETGYLVTQAGVVKDEDKIKQAIDAVLAEHKKIYQKGIPDKELAKAKEMIKGRMLLSMEDSFNVASFFGFRKLLEKKLISPEEAIAKIEKVSAKEVVDLAKEIFIPKRLNLSIIGPLEKKDFRLTM